MHTSYVLFQITLVGSCETAFVTLVVLCSLADEIIMLHLDVSSQIVVKGCGEGAMITPLIFDTEMAVPVFN